MLKTTIVLDRMKRRHDQQHIFAVNDGVQAFNMPNRCMWGMHDPEIQCGTGPACIESGAGGWATSDAPPGARGSRSSAGTSAASAYISAAWEDALVSDGSSSALCYLLPKRHIVHSSDFCQPQL